MSDVKDAVLVERFGGGSLPRGEAVGLLLDFDATVTVVIGDGTVSQVLMLRGRNSLAISAVLAVEPVDKKVKDVRIWALYNSLSI